MVLIVLEIVILLVLWLMSCAISAGIGFFYGGGKRKKIKPAALTREQKRQAEQAARELKNFWEYTGEEQEPINQ